jgi:hypothetical protein
LVEKMLVFYLTVPFMILAIAIAVGPLLWAMKHRQEREELPLPAAPSTTAPDERVAA